MSDHSNKEYSDSNDDSMEVHVDNNIDCWLNKQPSLNKKEGTCNIQVVGNKKLNLQG